MQHAFERVQDEYVKNSGEKLNIDVCYWRIAWNLELEVQ